MSAIGLAAGLAYAVAACGDRPLSPTDLAGLDGVWSGTSRLLSGRTEACAERVSFRMTISNAVVNGESWNLKNPGAPAKFSGYVETDGGMFVDVYLGGDRLRLTGRFSRSSFTGTYRSRRDCFGRLSLSRDSG